MTSEAGDRSERPSSMVAQYETLRRAALGHVLPLEARCGLMLFLRRGMWGWARAMVLSSTSVLQQPSCSASQNGACSDESRTLIHIFATMARTTENRGGIS
jgi:hypothetical protein